QAPLVAVEDSQVVDGPDDKQIHRPQRFFPGREDFLIVLVRARELLQVVVNHPQVFQATHRQFVFFTVVLGQDGQGFLVKRNGLFQALLILIEERQIEQRYRKPLIVGGKRRGFLKRHFVQMFSFSELAAC